MNPVPTDYQWLVLYQVDENDVVTNGVGCWKAKGPIGWTEVTGAIQRLYVLGLVDLAKDGTPSVNKDGMEVLKRRSVYDVVERMNRRMLERIKRSRGARDDG